MPLRRVAALAVLPVVVVVGAVLLPHSPSQLRDLVLAAGIAAPVTALAAWVLLTPAMFPGPVLAAAGGLAFGAVAGMALAWGGAVLGGIAAFALARTAARGPARRLVQRSPTLTRIHLLVERRGFAAVLAARLMPGVPASGLHYAAGVAPVRLRSFTAAIAIGALLRTTPYALLAPELASGSSATIMLGVASVAIGGAAAMLLVRRLRAPVPARSALRRDPP
jgi:uncharacterized membrane protein YdjX (TVP38/TMEM64 family)